MGQPGKGVPAVLCVEAVAESEQRQAPRLGQVGMESAAGQVRELAGQAEETGKISFQESPVDGQGSLEVWRCPDSVAQLEDLPEGIWGAWGGGGEEERSGNIKTKGEDPVRGPMEGDGNCSVVDLEQSFRTFENSLGLPTPRIPRPARFTHALQGFI